MLAESHGEESDSNLHVQALFKAFFTALLCRVDTAATVPSPVLAVITGAIVGVTVVGVAGAADPSIVLSAVGRLAVG